MSLTSDLNAIKTVQDGVKNNKVTRFAYTANAYANNDVDGHSDYVATRDNNIPLSDLSVIEVNQTVVDKGFRARASALNRMFLNHLFGRVSYNLNKINDLFNDLLVKVVANLGVPNGLATLDASGRIPYTQLPEDAMEYQGDWNAQTNTPTLADGTGTKGDTYNVSVGGTQDLGSGDIVFFAGDRVIYNGSVWQRASGGNVLTVSEIAPDEANGNVDLTKQNDITKIMSDSVLSQLGYGIGKVWVEDIGAEASSYIRINNLYKYEGKYFMCGSGSNPVLKYSVDGYNWTGISFASTTSAYQLIYGKGVYVARVGGKGIWWSEDLETWTQVTVTGITIETRETKIYFVGDLFICFVANENCVCTSTDGKNWTKIDSLGTSGWYIQSSAYYANGVYLLGGNGRWARSVDGSTWTLYTLSSSFVYDTIYINNVFYRIVGTSNTMLIQKSENDGVTWTTIGGNRTNIGYRFRLCNDKLFTVGDFDSTSIGSTSNVFSLLDYNDNMAVTPLTIIGSSLAVIYDETTHLYIAGKGGTSSGSAGDGIYWSKNGVDWFFSTKPALNESCMSLLSDNDIILAGTRGYKGLWYSNNEAIHKYLTEVVV